MAWQRGQDHDGLLSGSMLKSRPLSDAITRSTKAWLDDNWDCGHRPTSFLASPIIQQRVRDELPPVFPAIRGSQSIVKLFGMPVYPDPTVPQNELHLRDDRGDLIAVIVFDANE